MNCTFLGPELAICKLYSYLQSFIVVLLGVGEHYFMFQHCHGSVMDDFIATILSKIVVLTTCCSAVTL